MRFYTYQLRASDEDTLFYVGKTFEGSKRLVEHLHVARKDNRMISTKIRSILARGATVLLEPLAYYDTEPEVNAAEIQLIQQYGRKDIGTGFLCNHSDGGEGNVGYTHTPETREKMSKAKLGNKINLGRKRPDFAEKWKKPITVFDINGNVLYHFDSSKEAVEQLGVHKATLSDCLVGKCKTARGKEHVYQFRYGTLTDPISAARPRTRTGLGAIVQVDGSGSIIATYLNSAVAEEQTGILGTSIRNCLHGKAKTAGGYMWKLVEKSEG